MRFGLTQNCDFFFQCQESDEKSDSLGLLHLDGEPLVLGLDLGPGDGDADAALDAETGVLGGELGEAGEQPALVLEGVLVAGQPLQLVGHKAARLELALLLALAGVALARGVATLVHAGSGGEAWGK